MKQTENIQQLLDAVDVYTSVVNKLEGILGVYVRGGRYLLGQEGSFLEVLTVFENYIIPREFKLAYDYGQTMKTIFPKIYWDFRLVNGKDSGLDVSKMHPIYIRAEQIQK